MIVAPIAGIPSLWSNISRSAVMCGKPVIAVVAFSGAARVPAVRYTRAPPPASGPSPGFGMTTAVFALPGRCREIGEVSIGI